MLYYMVYSTKDRVYLTR